jgi:hypothetical protein
MSNDNKIKNWISSSVVILGIIYLIAIPSGLMKRKLEPVDLGFLMALMAVNSGIIERISQLKIGKDGVELSVEDVKETVDKQINDNLNKAASLLKSVDLQLSTTTSSEVQKELEKQILEANPENAEHIYYRAKELRHSAWLDKKKGLIERTIPIFQALTQSTYGKERHRFYAQLGYALKDQELSDWDKAKVSLDKAIEFWKKENPEAPLPPHYCFNWISCVLHLAKSRNVQTYLDKFQSDVCERIEASTKCKSLGEVLQEDPNFKDLRDWLTIKHLEAALIPSNESSCGSIQIKNRLNPSFS